MGSDKISGMATTLLLKSGTITNHFVAVPLSLRVKMGRQKWLFEGTPMKTSTVLHKQIRVSRINKNLSTSLAKHDLLLDDPKKRKKHRITELSKNNSYKFFGKEIKTESERKKALEYVNSLSYQNVDVDLNTLRKCKHKIKKWIDNSKTKPTEKAFFEKIMSASNQSINIEKALSYFNNLDKPSRFNDKIKALKTFISLNNEKVKLKINTTGSMLNTAVVSVLFKIPEHNGRNLTAEQQEILINDYYAKNFPNYPIILSIIHKDEAVPHVHMIVDAKNKSTGAYDFVQYQYAQTRAKHNLDFPKKHSELSQEQLSKAGELFQTDFYEHINNRQNKVLFAKKEYSSLEHKFIERQAIKGDTDKRIVDREYNTSNYLADRKNKLEVKVKELTLKISNLKLESSSISLENESKIELTKKLIDDCSTLIVGFIRNAMGTNLSDLESKLEQLHHISPENASKAYKLALKAQVEPEKISAIENMRFNQRRK